MGDFDRTERAVWEWGSEAVTGGPIVPAPRPPLCDQRPYRIPKVLRCDEAVNILTPTRVAADERSVVVGHRLLNSLAAIRTAFETLEDPYVSLAGPEREELVAIVVTELARLERAASTLARGITPL